MRGHAIFFHKHHSKDITCSHDVNPSINCEIITRNIVRKNNTNKGRKERLVSAGRLVRRKQIPQEDQLQSNLKLNGKKSFLTKLHLNEYYMLQQDYPVLPIKTNLLNRNVSKNMKQENQSHRTQGNWVRNEKTRSDSNMKRILFDKQRRYTAINMRKKQFFRKNDFSYPRTTQNKNSDQFHVEPWNIRSRDDKENDFLFL